MLYLHLSLSLTLSISVYLYLLMTVDDSLWQVNWQIELILFMESDRRKVALVISVHISVLVFHNKVLKHSLQGCASDQQLCIRKWLNFRVFQFFFPAYETKSANGIMIKSIWKKWCSKKTIPRLIRLKSMPIYGSEHHFFQYLLYHMRWTTWRADIWVKIYFSTKIEWPFFWFQMNANVIVTFPIFSKFR